MEQRATAVSSWPVPGGAPFHISKEVRLALKAAFAIGILTHLYALSNLLINHDGIISLHSTNAHLASGRWALEFFSQFSGLYELPVVIGLLSLLALALTAGLTVRVLELTHPVSIVLTAGLLVSFPAVACIFSYLFTADAYFIAILLASLSAYVAKYSWKQSKHLPARWLSVLLAALCIAVSCGIYQAFVGYAIGLLLFDCILRVLENEPIPEVLKTGVRYLLTILLGLILYTLILQAELRAHDMELTTYRGMDQAFSVDLRGYLSAIPSVYRDFLKYFWRVPYFTGKWIMIPRLLLAVSAVFGIFLLASCRHKKDFFPRICLTIVGAALLPVALSFASLITQNAGVYEIMRYSFVLLFVFSVKAAELSASRLLVSFPKWWAVPIVISLLLCGSLIWNNVCVINTAYLRKELCMENTSALANRIAARIEATPGYTKETPVVFSGDPSGYGSQNSFPELASLAGLENKNYINWYTGNEFLYRFTAFRRTMATNEQMEDVRASGILDTMPEYPDHDAVRLYNGILVVKFDDSGYIW